MRIYRKHKIHAAVRTFVGEFLRERHKLTFTRLLAENFSSNPVSFVLFSEVIFLTFNKFLQCLGKLNLLFRKIFTSTRKV
jgi:hypothetical protein